MEVNDGVFLWGFYGCFLVVFGEDNEVNEQENAHELFACVVVSHGVWMSCWFEDDDEVNGVVCSRRIWMLL